MLKCKHFINWKLCLKIWQKAPPQAVTSSVSCWPSGVNYFIPVISVRASQGATHTSFEVPEQASFKDYFIFLVVICVKLGCNVLKCKHFINWKLCLKIWQKSPPPQDEGNFLTLDLSISDNFEQLWFLWQKSPTPRMREIFLHRIYPFQAILSNSSFCGRKVPPLFCLFVRD